MSTYQLWTFVTRVRARSTARSEKLTGERPGGHERHFWVPL